MPNGSRSNGEGSSTRPTSCVRKTGGGGSPSSPRSCGLLVDAKGNTTAARVNFARVARPLKVKSKSKTLKELIHGDDGFEKTCRYKDVIDVLKNTAMALRDLHADHHVHCTLNATNILIAEDKSATIASSAHSVKRERETFSWRLVGTMGYIPPDILIPNGDAKLTTSVDIYALGTICMEFLSRKHPCDMFLADPDPEWSSLDGHCEPYMSNGELVVRPTSDPDVFKRLCANSNGRTVDSVLTLPDEIMKLGENALDTDDQSGDVQKKYCGYLSRALKRLQAMDGKPWDQKRLPWPPELCALIGECVGHPAKRPDASVIVERLDKMKDRPWVNFPLPWVDKVRNRQAQIEGLKRGHCRTYELLGEGAFGAVYKGVFRDTNGKVHDVAVKVKKEDRKCEEFQNELNTYNKLKADHPEGHPYVINCFGGNLEGCEWTMKNLERIEMEGGGTVIVLPLMPGSLYDLSRNKVAFKRIWTSKDKIVLFKRIAEGLAFLHSNNIVHFDLKPGNVLIAEDGTPRITDLGWSKLRDRTSITRTERGTPGFMAFELYSGIVDGIPVRISDKVDIFSYGKMLEDCLEVDPKIPKIPKIAELIEDCLAMKLDADRFMDRPSAGKVAESLGEML